ncbi:unnamed protein product [Rotaria socialis]|uniref:Major facilitator superfamily (MFS) profile domain-containing protein n=1 Tax=Rotaria socialis TaxID=392032 RepID=A0A821NI55_9BILA|nr:unnamed protein product [Rotaria socialis]
MLLQLPEIAKHTVNALPRPYSGAYLTTLCECTLLLLSMTLIQFPNVKKADYAIVSTLPSKMAVSNNKKTTRSIFVIAFQRKFLIAALGGFVSWSAMAVQMSATPLAMTRAGYQFSQSTTVIEFHLLGMFVPSFFTGTLCNLLGSRLVMLAGLLIQLTGALLFQRGFQFNHFNLGLIIVGVGWNFGYVGASALLTESHRHDEKQKTHSLYEAIVMSSISIAFFSSAFMEQRFGWITLTGKIISTYLALAVLIVFVDTVLALFQSKDVRMPLPTNDEDIQTPA